MSVIVKGMEMPENCGMCDLAHRNFDGNETRLACYALRKWAEESGDVRLPDCPLIELPEKHGRLIDADALHRLFEEQWHYLQVLDWDENPTAESKQTGINWCINTMHDDAPTVIEAEGDE